MILTTANAALTPVPRPLPLLLPQHALHLERLVSVKALASRVQAVAILADIVREMTVSSAAPMPALHPLLRHALLLGRLVSVKVPARRAQAVVLSAGTVLEIVVFVSLSSNPQLSLSPAERKRRVVLQPNTHLSEN